MKIIDKGMRIKITCKGPYQVSGHVPLLEKIIVPKGNGYEFADGCPLPQSESYALCRCGRSKHPPFCDGSHVKTGFIGTETASRAQYEDRADILEGPAMDLLDDGRCAYARFCHRNAGNAWELTRNSDDETNKNEAMQAAYECPSGRLAAMDKAGKIYDPEYEPSVNIIQDPQKNVSGGIFVKGNIPIEAADGQIYEPRNRVVLCRCGRSANKPFCDATHIPISFNDK